MITLPDGISYNGVRSNFERDCFDTLTDMNEYVKAYGIDDGHLSFCVATRKYYMYDAKFVNSNGTLGKWIEFKQGGSTPPPSLKLEMDEANNTLIFIQS